MEKVPQSQPSPPGKKPLKVLILDDELIWRENLSIWCEGAGFTTATAVNFEEATRLFHSQKPDVIVTDLLLTSYDHQNREGQLFVQYIRDVDKFCPIIVISGVCSREDVATLMDELSVNVVLFKMEFDPTKFIVLVKDLVAEASLVKRSSLPSEGFFQMTNKAKDAHSKGPEQSFSDNIALHLSQLVLDNGYFGSFFHKIANDIGLARGTIRLLKQETEDLPEAQALCERLERMFADFFQTLRQFRMFARIGQAESSLRPIEISRMVDRLGELVSLRVPRSRIDFTTEVEAKLSNLALVTDEEQLVIVLLELINNAIHAIGDKINGSIKLSFENQGEQLKISVQDNGPGIPPALCQKLFKERVQSSRTNGLGMGLYFSGKVIEAIGGRLFLETTSAEGSTFVITLPISGQGGHD